MRCNTLEAQAFTGVNLAKNNTLCKNVTDKIEDQGSEEIQRHVIYSLGKEATFQGGGLETIKSTVAVTCPQIHISKGETPKIHHAFGNRLGY